MPSFCCVRKWFSWSISAASFCFKFSFSSFICKCKRNNYKKIHWSNVTTYWYSGGQIFEAPSLRYVVSVCIKPEQVLCKSRGIHFEFATVSSRLIRTGNTFIDPVSRFSTSGFLPQIISSGPLIQGLTYFRVPGMASYS
jgi:hypothetical protein